MSVIIRLQNLPWSANALDIRQFFGGLSIPEGGVHIVGGELGDAFIAFSTDEDARQAFMLNGGKIKEIQVKLMLSSRTEMQKVIEAARNPLAAFMQAPVPVPQVPQVPPPLPALIPMPAAVPEIVPINNGKIIDSRDTKEKDKRDRRRSRSRSRDRKDRSRDRSRDRRDRRRRDRTRSRSRDRRDRRRRDRSHSREKRSKERDRRSKDRVRNDDKKDLPKMSSVGVWEDPIRNEPAAAPVLQQAQALLSTLIPGNLEEARRNLNALAPPSINASLLLANRNGFQGSNDFISQPPADMWTANPPQIPMNNRLDVGSRFHQRGLGRNEDNNFNSRTGSAISREEGRKMHFEPPARNSSRPSRFDERPERPERPDRINRMTEQCLNCCVQLRPYYGGYGEVRRFFSGIFIHNTGIKFVNDDRGKRTGIVYIRFATIEGKEKALLRSGGMLKNQSVEIQHIDDKIFEDTPDRYQPEHDDRSSPVKPKKSSLSVYTCVAVEDLPLFTKEQDMLKIFSEYSLLSINLVNRQRHITGYIKFSNSDDAKKALTEKSKFVFDGQPLNIRPCTDEEYALHSGDELEESQEPEILETMDITGDDDDELKLEPLSECVCLSGLPLKTTDCDITDFFSDVAIVPIKIHLINSNLGFTGVAYCEFSNLDEASVALEKNGLPLGSGIVNVDSVSRDEMENKLGTATAHSMPPMSRGPPMGGLGLRPSFFPRNFRGGPRGMGLMGHRPPPRRFMHPPIHAQGDPSDIAPPGHIVRMENVPYKAGLDEILEFFEGFDIPADNVLRRYNENGTPSGEAKVIFKSSEDASQAVNDRNYSKIRDRTVYLYQC